MKFKIGFLSETAAERTSETKAAATGAARPARSVVRVFFPARNAAYSYYNDRFDLRAGDLVFVEGKLEGLRGTVTEVSRSFKIKLSDYKRVIGVADTDLRGSFRMAGSHLVAFDRTALPYEKARGWFLPPEAEEEEYASGGDGEIFPFDDPAAMGFQPQTAQRGHEYYLQNKVRYLSLDGMRCRAVVEGSMPYEVEFSCDADAREAGGFVCSCYCSGLCKHGFAALLQLRDTLDWIGENAGGASEPPSYFAAADAQTTFSLAAGKRGGTVTFG